jgi:phospholipase C
MIRPEAIKHVVVLMFENRSFDHLFGAFPGANGILAENGGVKPEIYNLADPTQPPGPSNQTYVPVPITPDVPLTHDFDHDFATGMMRELFGPTTTGWVNGQPLTAPAVTWPSTNSGFVSTPAYNVDGTGQTPNGPQAMSYYPYGSLQVLHPLASEFVLCDNWFCDMPGDTLLNRYFMHTAQTGGVLSDSQAGNITIDVPTIFDQIPGQPPSWKMYAPWAEKNGETIPNPQIDSRFLQTIQDSSNTNLPITEFVSDMANGTLPLYSFLMCWLPLNVSSQETDTSMHPNSDIRPGENYLAAVYNALRNSPRWNDTLLIVTFDENGGMYDHVVPPMTTAPQPGTLSDPDPYTGETFQFDFTLLGPRIPAILISPWLRSGIAKAQYQNTSILRFIQSMIGAPGLTGRDANAPALDTLLAEFGLSQPRTDCPASFAGYAGFPYADGDLSQTYVVPPGKEMVPPPYMARLAKVYGLG